MDTAAWTISIIAIGIAVVLAVRWEMASRRRRARRVVEEPPRLEFMSPAWIAMARQEITRALSQRDLDVQPFTLSEEFTNAPQHLRRGSEPIGFSVRVGQGRVDVADRPDPAADCRVISDYHDAREIARDPAAASTDPDEASRRVAAGLLTIEGDPTRMPVALQQLDVHRLLAEHTA